MTQTRDHSPAERAGLLWAWWQGDPLPALPALDGWRAATSTGHGILQQLSGLSAAEIAARGDGAPSPRGLDRWDAGGLWLERGRTDAVWVAPGLGQRAAGERYL